MKYSPKNTIPEKINGIAGEIFKNIAGEEVRGYENEVEEVKKLAQKCKEKING